MRRYVQIEAHQGEDRIWSVEIKTSLDVDEFRELVLKISAEYPKEDGMTIKSMRFREEIELEFYKSSDLMSRLDTGSGAFRCAVYIVHTLLWCLGRNENPPSKIIENQTETFQ